MEQLLLVMVVLIVVIMISWIIATRNHERRILFKILVLGALGWTVAFLLRLVPLGILQSMALLILGADFSDSESIASLSYHPLVIIWGPILATLFEEGVRYFIILKHEPVERNPSLGPLSLGLGWSSAEILLIYGASAVAVAFTPGLQEPSEWVLVFLGGFERISATIIHVALSYLVLQAKSEQFPRTVSLWLAMVFHLVINGLAITWLQLAGVLIGNDALLLSLSLEIGIFIVALAVLSFVHYYWIPRKKRNLHPF